MITRMISSKNSEIYSIVKKKVKEKKEKEELRKLELQQQDIIKSPSESKADETNDNNEDDDESELDEFKKLNQVTEESEEVPENEIRLEPSGIVTEIHVDPDKTSDEEDNPVHQIMMRKGISIKKVVEPPVVDVKVNVDEEKQKYLQMLEEKKNSKEFKQKMKDMNKNFNRQDKRDTHKFLMKHGLTLDEAKDYS